MSIKLNKKAYQELIDQDIEELNKHMSEHSLERKHIVEVLKWSVEQLYPEKNKKTFGGFKNK